MTDQGYNVFWNEPKLDGTPQGAAERRHFMSKCAADTFASSIPEEKRPRVYSSVPADIDVIEERWDTVGRDETDVLNRQRMVRLMGLHNITIPAKQFDKWRPTEEKTGNIEGVADGLTCIMTDGLLGYFLREGKEPLYGHMEWFKWDSPNTSYIPYLTDSGEEKFFKQVTDHGAPPAYYKRPKRLAPPRQKKIKVKKAHVPMTSASALDLIARMTKEMQP